MSSFFWWAQKTHHSSHARLKFGEGVERDGFEKFVKSEYSTCINECDHKKNGQMFWLTDETGNMIVDFVGRFENFQSEFNLMCDKWGVSRKRLPHKLKTKRESYQKYYTEETRDIIAELYKRDIEAFGYQFGDYELPKKATILMEGETNEQTSDTKELDYTAPQPIDPEVKLKDEPIKKIKRIVSTTGEVDVDILVCINSCEKDTHHLNLFKESELYRKFQKSENIGILEFYRGNEKPGFEAGKILLTGDERYDKLHIKTYDMIKWCVENLKFNHLVKLDCNFMTYTHVGERTRRRICGEDRVDRLVYHHRRNKSYDGTNGRSFRLRDFRAWSKQKQIVTLLEEPYWLSEELWYYCGKAYKVSYDFAKFIATSERCKHIVGQHDMKNALGYHPFAVEDVMIGRMHEKYLEKSL